MRELVIYGGIIVLLDDSDFAIECCHKWSLNNYGYPRRQVKRKTILLHKNISKRMGLIGEIDHEDRNKLNCQKYNLREATHQQNCQNRSVQSNSTTGVPGVHYHQRANKYCPHLKIDGKWMHLGSCDTLEEAIAIRRQAEIKYFGEFAPN